MLKFRLHVAAICLSASLFNATPTQPAVGTPATAGVAIASLTAATAIVGTGGTIICTTDSWWKGLLGGVIALGGVAIGVLDPPGGTFYNGQLQLHYNPAVMQRIDDGWLGPWGLDPLQPRPQVEPADCGGFPLQAPNAALSATVVDDGNGILTIDFDWGPSGYTETEDPFTFFCAAFQFITPVQFQYLGDFASPPPGANFYVSMVDEIQCEPPLARGVIGPCGHPVTSYFRITEYATSVRDDQATARTLVLSEGHPNPFTLSTTIGFTLPSAGRVLLRVYDTGGRIVCSLLDEYREAGTYAVQWQGRDDQGRRVAAGAYFYRLEAAGQELTRKIVLVK